MSHRGSDHSRALTDAELAVTKIAAGQWDEERTATWLGDHLAPPGDTTGTQIIT